MALMLLCCMLARKFPQPRAGRGSGGLTSAKNQKGTAAWGRPGRGRGQNTSRRFATNDELLRQFAPFMSKKKVNFRLSLLVEVPLNFVEQLKFVPSTYIMIHESFMMKRQKSWENVINRHKS